ncbi:MAG: bacteriocin [Dysgonamonadaceae bacterium]|jgi:bacteriocin-like protein|nr:bacteriocin [Dysgonamonadaceae bacterium]
MREIENAIKAANLKELSNEEMSQIDGGNIMYWLGYACSKIEDFWSGDSGAAMKQMSLAAGR